MKRFLTIWALLVAVVFSASAQDRRRLIGVRNVAAAPSPTPSVAQYAYEIGTTVTVTNSVSAGNLLVFMAGVSASGAGVTGVTDNLGNTYTLITNRNDGASSTCSMWYAKNISGGACIVTSSVSARITVVELTNCSTSSPYDSQAAGFSAGTPTLLTSGDFTTVSATTIALSVTRANNAGTLTAGPTGWGALMRDAAAGSTKYIIQTNSFVAVTTTNAVPVADAGQPYVTAAASFK